MTANLKKLIFATLILVACNPTSHRDETVVRSNSSMSAEIDANHHKQDSVNQNTAAEYDTLKNRIDFKATGNEPFWLLEINFEKFIHFKMLDGIEITAPVPDGMKNEDANVARYRIVTEQGELIVQIAKQECINDMSGKKSDYNVHVELKEKADRDNRMYKGCGEYISKKDL